MDIWQSNTLIYEGPLQYKKKMKLASRWKWFTGEVLQETSEGPKRLALYEEESHIFVLSISLDEVRDVSPAEGAENVRHAFKIITPHKNYLLGAKSSEQRDYWISHLLDVVMAVPLPNIVYQYEVQVLPNTHSNSLNLRGSYVFKISDTHIALFSTSGLLVTQFLLDLIHVRRTRYTFFNRTPSSPAFYICTIYTSSRSPLGEGTYVLSTHSGADLSKILSCRLTRRYSSLAMPLPPDLLDEKSHPSVQTGNLSQSTAHVRSHAQPVKSLFVNSLPVTMTMADNTEVNGSSREFPNPRREASESRVSHQDRGSSESLVLDDTSIDEDGYLKVLPHELDPDPSHIHHQDGSSSDSLVLDNTSIDEDGYLKVLPHGLEPDPSHIHHQDGSSSDSLVLDDTSIGEDGYLKVLPHELEPDPSHTHHRLTVGHTHPSLVATCHFSTSNWSHTPLNHTCSVDTALSTLIDRTHPVMSSGGISDGNITRVCAGDQEVGVVRGLANQSCTDLHTPFTEPNYITSSLESHDFTSMVTENIYATVDEALETVAQYRDEGVCPADDGSLLPNGCEDMHEDHTSCERMLEAGQERNDRTVSISKRPPARLPATPHARLPATPPARLTATLPARLTATPPARLTATPPARLTATLPARLTATPPAHLPPTICVRMASFTPPNSPSLLDASLNGHRLPPVMGGGSHGDEPSGDGSHGDEDDYVYANRENLGDMFLRRRFLSNSSQCIYVDLQAKQVMKKSSSFSSVITDPQLPMCYPLW